MPTLDALVPLVALEHHAQLSLAISHWHAAFPGVFLVGTVATGEARRGHGIEGPVGRALKVHLLRDSVASLVNAFSKMVGTRAEPADQAL